MTRTSLSPSPSPQPQMSDAVQILYVTLTFIAIVIVVGWILYLCIRENEDIKRNSSAPPDDATTIDIIKKKLVMYSSRQLNIITNNFKNKLGQGGFGVVYKGTLDDGVSVAVKVLHGDWSNKLIRCQFEAEVRLIRRTDHPNLVKLYGFCFDKRLKALVYEFMENGSLDGFLFNKEKNKIEWEKLYSIAIGTAKGIAYLHEDCPDKIIHYDVKPANILLDVELKPKVSDFGLAKLYSRDATHVPISGFKGTFGYAAPEMWSEFLVTSKCDVYSFGKLLFEILGRRRNLDSKNSGSLHWLPMYVWNKFDEGTMEEMVSCLGINEKDKEMAKRMAIVALWCVQHQPELRPSMSTVVKIMEGEMTLHGPPNPFPQMSSHVCRNARISTSSVSSNTTIWLSAISTWFSPTSTDEYLIPG
ncbi:LEAF RUST 10 DISEASE-RESISTANCE LOCUS RECEPTOR-LIKE PROTEIN KINASE-like 2.4 [Magnolia sinica]|uniref:LEAF RUST 10 DISEASE-RESISTANCE LOCUS RECEPTOR-LIKE PROTEIN KINASE-like 2.4 n=1 Tax=Magnolia sinica TaxID=86752 RepID=UPI002657B41F|nr:LEAF RUST 10 DISEASE-RESISTANCE LOCUS RECEPTOR-LIKE PROTEIN KINASE-like 2.4 [Magnolia sinica]